jgi:hypothetical protein
MRIYCAVLLILAGVSIVSAKSYRISLVNMTAVGGSQLKAGEYSLEVKGENAIFTSDDSGKKFTIPVKVQTVQTKHQGTVLQTTSEGGTSRLKAIEVGGSTTLLQF